MGLNSTLQSEQNISVKNTVAVPLNVLSEKITFSKYCTGCVIKNAGSTVENIKKN